MGAPGYAILSALLIAALVMVAAGALLSVVVSDLSVVGLDREALRARAAADEGVAAAGEALRWGWISAPATLRRPARGPGCSFEVAIDLAAAEVSRVLAAADLGGESPGVAATERRFWSVVSVGRCGDAVRRVEAVLVVTPDALPRGVVVDGGVSLHDGLDLVCCGLYAGGDVAGREFVRLLDAPDDAGAGASEVPDRAYGGLYALAAVHACGVIARDGIEVHEPAGTPAPGDDDRHTGGGPPAYLLASPTWGVRSALESHASDAGPALRDGVLSLTAIPRSPAADDILTGPAAGRVVIVGGDALSAGVTVVGDRDVVPGASALTLVVDGDCTLGAVSDPGGAVSFSGALVVFGHLTVVAPTSVRGGVWAAGLDVRAPLAVAAAAAAPVSGQESTPGASNVQIGAWSE